MPEPITLIGVGGGILGLTAHLARRYFEAAKELADVVLGLLLAVIALPVVVFCAILVRLSSRGPVFFVQQRVGRDGKAFRMYKLRTMYADAEAKSGPSGPARTTLASSGGRSGSAAAISTSCPNCSTSSGARCPSSARGRSGRKSSPSSRRSTPTSPSG